MALLYSEPRSASVYAMTDSVLFTIDRKAFSEFIKSTSLEQRDKYLEFLNSVPILARLYTYDRQNLCDALNHETFKEGDFVIETGIKADKFYIVYSGYAQILKETDGENKLAYECAAKDYFGELAIVNKTLTTQTVVAKSSELEVLSLDKNTFKRLLPVIGWDISQNESRYQF